MSKNVSKQKEMVNELITSVEDSIKATLKASHKFDAVAIIVSKTEPLEGFASADNKAWYPFSINCEVVKLGI